MTILEADAELDAWIGRMVAVGHSASDALNAIAWLIAVEAWDSGLPEEQRKAALTTGVRSFYGAAG